LFRVEKKEKILMVKERRIKILIANPGLDVHDAGARYVAKILSDAGMEVIYLGIRQTAEGIVNAAIQEAVDIIGLSILSGRHTSIVPRISGLLRERNIHDMQIVVGGIIPKDDMETLKKHGAKEIFLPGTPSDFVVEKIKNLMKN
jgi:methylmalonyl-CoA mutase C-terminal domain/subunit